jgi:hypothetical protein
MTEIRKGLAIGTTLLLVCLGVDIAESQNAHPSSAIKDLSIVDGPTCNEPDPPGTVEYLENGNRSKSIVAKLRRTDSPSEGKPESSIETYTVPPNGKVELGCSRLGGGAPIVVDTFWEVQSARYK